jgi:hypothetical protein
MSFGTVHAGGRARARSSCSRNPPHHAGVPAGAPRREPRGHRRRSHPTRRTRRRPSRSTGASRAASAAIANLTEALAKAGWSDGLAAKLAEEGSRVARLNAERRSTGKPTPSHARSSPWFPPAAPSSVCARSDHRAPSRAASPTVQPHPTCPSGFARSCTESSRPKLDRVRDRQNPAPRESGFSLRLWLRGRANGHA